MLTDKQIEAIENGSAYRDPMQRCVMVAIAIIMLVVAGLYSYTMVTDVIDPLHADNIITGDHFSALAILIIFIPSIILIIGSLTILFADPIPTRESIEDDK